MWEWNLILRRELFEWEVQLSEEMWLLLSQVTLFEAQVRRLSQSTRTWYILGTGTYPKSISNKETFGYESGTSWVRSWVWL